MKIWMPERILDRQVGGNTTYARNVARGLYERGIDVRRIRAANIPAGTAFLETVAAVRAPKASSVLHYVADTGPLLPTKGPSVVTVHGVASRWISTARTPAQELVWRQRVAAAIRNTRRVITVSNSSANDVSDVFGVPRDQIDVIHHGIDHGMFSAPSQLSPELASQLPNDFILYVGNIEPRKNLISLVKAVDSLSRTSSSLHLVIAGRPAWNYEASMAAISSSPNVTYLGFVNDNDRRSLMQKCKFFVFPSLYEGFGFPILEAMAAGAPVLTTDRGSLAEVSGPAKTIPGTEPDDIAAALVGALHAEEWYAEAPDEGREWAATFKWDKSVSQHIAVYEELLK